LATNWSILGYREPELYGGASVLKNFLRQGSPIRGVCLIYLWTETVPYAF
jgi:hypothetical protein